jgi:hypothetical protein
MCACECADFEFEEYILEEIIMMKDLDQFPSLQLGNLIIKMFINSII